jgi:hypothetical protein
MFKSCKGALLNRQRSANDYEESLVLLKILNNSQGFNLFREITKKESLYSYLMFWRDVELYRNKEIDLISILNSYLNIKSTLYIALPQDICQKILNHVESSSETLECDDPLRTIFDEAYVFVFKILLDLYRENIDHMKLWKSRLKKYKN